jgi:mitogen-activated protein kinase 1/3
MLILSIKFPSDYYYYNILEHLKMKRKSLNLG